MVSKIHSLGIKGIGGYAVSVECFLSSGLPAFEIVGLPDAAVKEARDRVRAAIKNAVYKLRKKLACSEYTIANIRGEGYSFERK